MSGLAWFQLCGNLHARQLKTYCDEMNVSYIQWWTSPQADLESQKSP